MIKSICMLTETDFVLPEICFVQHAQLFHFTRNMHIPTLWCLV